MPWFIVCWVPVTWAARCGHGWGELWDLEVTLFSDYVGGIRAVILPWILITPCVYSNCVTGQVSSKQKLFSFLKLPVQLFSIRDDKQFQQTVKCFKPILGWSWMHHYCNSSNFMVTLNWMFYKKKSKLTCLTCWLYNN